MKKIDSWTVEAIKNNGAGVYSCDNTVVRVAPDGARIVELFGNKIFYINARGVVFFTLAGWNTATTRARLNALLHYYFNIGISSRGGVAILWGRTFADVQLEADAWYSMRGGVVEKVTRFD